MIGKGDDLKDSNTKNQSTVAAFAILEAMAAHTEPVRVTDLAVSLGMPRSRIFRYLRTLVSLGYVRQDPESERYRLTLKLFHLGQAIADGTQLTSVARPVMSAIRDEVGQTVTLSIPEDDGMRVIDIVRTETPVQIITRPGALLDFHSSAQGKVALAWGRHGVADVLGTLARANAPASPIIDHERLEREVDRARTSGWAVAPEETLPGVNAVSAPIFDSGAEFVATITIVGSVQYIRPEPDPALVTVVTEAARTISTHLGCLEYPV